MRLLAPLRDDLAAWKPDDAAPDTLVFPAADGAPWSDTAYRNWRRRVWAPAAAAVGVDGARPYDLRHSFVSLLIHEGASPVDVARQAGHAPTMALNSYGHVFDEAEGTERMGAEAAISAARGESNVYETCTSGASTLHTADASPSKKPA